MGAYYASGYNHTLIEYWDGSSWRIVPSPNPSRDYNELFHVWVTTPGDVWAVGAYDDSGLNPGTGAGASIPYTGWKTLLLHWNGQSWDQIDSPNLGVGSELVGVTGSSVLNSTLTSNWAVGSYISDGLAPSQTLIEHITAPTPPTRTTSYYENSISLTDHHTQGCMAAANHESGIIILDYGRAEDWGTLGRQYGTELIGTLSRADISNANAPGDITRAAEMFAKGYDDAFYNPLPSLSCPHVQGPEGVITVSISINNQFNVLPASERVGHAQAWAQMIKDVQNYVNTNLHGNIVVAAGLDAEPNFDNGYLENQLSATEQWGRAYSDTNVAPYYDFGSLDAYPCRPSAYPGFPDPLPCSVWKVDRDYMVSWGIPQARPLPEIYKPVFAREWYIVKRWGIERYPNSPYMDFKGEMTECLSGCGVDELHASQAWPIMWLELNSDSVRGIGPGSSTDIKCSNGIVGNACSTP